MFLIYLTFILCALPSFKFCFYNCGYDQSVINVFYLTKKKQDANTRISQSCSISRFMLYLIFETAVW